MTFGDILLHFSCPTPETPIVTSFLQVYTFYSQILRKERIREGIEKILSFLQKVHLPERETEGFVWTSDELSFTLHRNPRWEERISVELWPPSGKKYLSVFTSFLEDRGIDVKKEDEEVYKFFAPVKISAEAFSAYLSSVLEDLDEILGKAKDVLERHISGWKRISEDLLLSPEEEGFLLFKKKLIRTFVKGHENPFFMWKDSVPFSEDLYERELERLRNYFKFLLDLYGPFETTLICPGGVAGVDYLMGSIWIPEEKVKKLTGKEEESFPEFDVEKEEDIDLLVEVLQEVAPC